MAYRKNYYLFFFITFSIIAGAILEWQRTITENQLHVTAATLSQSFQPINQIKTEEIVKQKPPEQVVKGIYLTAYSAANGKKIDQIIELINKTELNAIVIDIKDYSGKILYDSQIPLINKLGTKEKRIKKLPELIKKLHDNKIYVIARLTVFQDPELAQKKPEWSLKSKNGGIWHDKNGLSWVDMTNQRVWKYNTDIAKEAIDLGFDEINFDYIRYPSDGLIKNIVYADNRPKYEVMRNFYHYLSRELNDYPAWTSLDLFGLVLEHSDDMGIGQRIVDAVDEVDFISPMMYPSHYYPGHLNFSNPSEHPAEIIENGMKKGSPLFVNHRAKLRPWLQAFDLGAKYDAKKIRAQIDMVEKYSNAGWLLWNAPNKYTDAGLKLEN